MSDDGIGRPVGVSPSTEFANLSQVVALPSSPVIFITATIVSAATIVSNASTQGGLIHVASAGALDVLYVQVFNNSANSVVVYGQLGTTATTTSVPLSLSAKTSGFIFNALPIGNSGVVGLWNDTATSGIVAVGSVQRVFV